MVNGLQVSQKKCSIQIFFFLGISTEENIQLKKSFTANRIW